jgi:sensitive to high expression protein 9, mitochondrial
MLRISRSSKRLPLRRQLSTSSSPWNISRPSTTDPIREQSKPELSPSQVFDPSDGINASSPPATEPSKSPESTESPSLSSYNAEIVKQRIREWTEQAAIVLRNRADGFTATTKATFSQLGSELNRVTGYEEIEDLKRGVVEQGRILYIHSSIASQVIHCYNKRNAYMWLGGLLNKPKLLMKTRSSDAQIHSAK